MGLNMTSNMASLIEKIFKKILGLFAKGLHIQKKSN